MKTPTLWDIVQVTATRMIRRAQGESCDARRDTILLDAAVAVRAGRYEQAAALLDPFARVLGCDAAYLNLLGVIREARKELKPASRFYGLAISFDPTYLPAQQNIRRMYEMNTFGQAREPVNLGDTELRANRRVPSTIRILSLPRHPLAGGAVSH